MDDKYDKLIFKILNGNFNANEFKQLKLWLESDALNRKYFEQTKILWNISFSTRYADDCLLDDEEQKDIYYKKQQRKISINLKRFEVFMQQIDRRKNKNHRFVFLTNHLWNIIILCLIGVVVYWRCYLIQEEILPIKKTMFSKVISKNVILETSYGQKINIGEKDSLLICHNNHLLLETKQGNLQYLNNDDNILRHNVHYHKLTTPYGREFVLFLEDGSKIWLNAATTIRYPDVFQKNKREIFLEGEAFFEISKETRPFIIKTNQVDIEVYGTTFNVNTHFLDGSIEAVLHTGRIGLRSKLPGAKEIILMPSYYVRFSKLGKFISSGRANLSRTLAWREGRFSFTNERLEEILNTLSFWYNFKVFYDNEELKEYRFTGEFYKYKDIKIVLDAITKMTPIQYSLQSGTLFLLKKTF